MWFVYIILCSDKSFYTGITNNLDKRFKNHLSGKGSKYLRSRKPEKIIYTEPYLEKSEALKREIEIKSWSRAEKIKNLSLSF